MGRPIYHLFPTALVATGSLAGGVALAILGPTPAPSTLEVSARLDAGAPSYDGRGNHMADPGKGAVQSPYRRLLPASDAPEELPPPRIVSNRVHAHAKPFESLPDPEGHSLMLAAFGQFLTHDISLRAKSRRPRFLVVGDEDPKFPPGALIPYAPNRPHPESGAPFNRTTSWIDGSMIYGHHPVRADALRSHRSGRLRTSEGDQLPRFGWDDDRQACRWPANGRSAAELHNENPRREPLTALYLAGDERANENPLLLGLHTVFLREHNRRAATLKAAHPDWTDEDIFQAARRWVIGLLQSITFREYLPALLGPDALRAYGGYRPDRAAGLSLEMVGAALRMGHSQMSPMLRRLGPGGREFKRSHVSLKAAFFAPVLYRQEGGGPASWLMGAVASPAQAVDLVIVDDLRNYMFGNLMGGLDLAAINIQIGRESGLLSYAAVRSALGLAPISDFDDVSEDPKVRRALAELYGAPERIDLWVGLLAEPPHPGAAVGSTARAILVEGFERLRDGDRFFVARDHALDRSLAGVRLGDVIRRNLGREWKALVPRDVFSVK